MTITSLTPGAPAASTARHVEELGLRESATFDRATIADIQRAAATGVYDIRGWGAKRKVPHFDDLLFLGASMSRYPLEGYREKCDTDVVLGDRLRHQAAAPADPGDHRRNELRRAVRQRQGSAGSRRQSRWAPPRQRATAA